MEEFKKWQSDVVRERVKTEVEREKKVETESSEVEGKDKMEVEKEVKESRRSEVELDRG